MKTDTSKTFLITYHHDEADWVLELKARDIEDARARLAKLSCARIDGEIIAKVPAFSGPLAISAIAIRNGLAWLWRTKPKRAPTA
jgi:hypothetical protein